MTDAQPLHPTLALPVLILKCFPAILQGEAYARTASAFCSRFACLLRPSDRHLRAGATNGPSLDCSRAATGAAIARPLARLLPAPLGIPQIPAALHSAPAGVLQSRQLAADRHADARWQDLPLHR